MANPENPSAFKHAYDEAAVRRIAARIADEVPAFDADGFLASTLPVILDLELKARVELLAEALHAHLPLPFPEAASALIPTLVRREPPLARTRPWERSNRTPG